MALSTTVLRMSGGSMEKLSKTRPPEMLKLKNITGLTRACLSVKLQCSRRGLLQQRLCSAKTVVFLQPARTMRIRETQHEQIIHARARAHTHTHTHTHTHRKGQRRNYPMHQLAQTYTKFSSAGVTLVSLKNHQGKPHPCTIYTHPH